MDSFWKQHPLSHCMLVAMLSTSLALQGCSKQLAAVPQETKKVERQDLNDEQQAQWAQAVELLQHHTAAPLTASSYDQFLAEFKQRTGQDWADFRAQNEATVKSLADFMAAPPQPPSAAALEKALAKISANRGTFAAPALTALDNAVASLQQYQQKTSQIVTSLTEIVKTAQTMGNALQEVTTQVDGLKDQNVPAAEAPQKLQAIFSDAGPLASIATVDKKSFVESAEQLRSAGAEADAEYKQLQDAVDALNKLVKDRELSEAQGSMEREHSTFTKVLKLAAGTLGSFAGTFLALCKVGLPPVVSAIVGGVVAIIGLLAAIFGGKGPGDGPGKGPGNGSGSSGQAGAGQGNGPSGSKEGNESSGDPSPKVPPIEGGTPVVTKNHDGVHHYKAALVGDQLIVRIAFDGNPETSAEVAVPASADPVFAKIVATAREGKLDLAEIGKGDAAAGSGSVKYDVFIKFTLPEEAVRLAWPHPAEGQTLRDVVPVTVDG